MGGFLLVESMRGSSWFLQVERMQGNNNVVVVVAMAGFLSAAYQHTRMYVEISPPAYWLHGASILL